MWALVKSWNDGEDDDIEFVDVSEKVAEEVALHTCSRMCREDLGWSCEDHPRLRDAEGQIDPGEEMEELEGLFELLCNKEQETDAFPSLLFSFHHGLNSGWGKFQKGMGGVRHAVLGPWCEDPYASSLASLVHDAWSRVLTNTVPPKEVLQLLIGFTPIMLDSGLNDDLREALRETESALDSKIDSVDAKFQSPGLDCCYECLENFDPKCSVEASGDLIWAKKDEGYSYEQDPEILFFCAECFEDYNRY